MQLNGTNEEKSATENKATGERKHKIADATHGHEIAIGKKKRKHKNRNTYTHYIEVKSKRSLQYSSDKTHIYSTAEQKVTSLNSKQSQIKSLAHVS